MKRLHYIALTTLLLTACHHDEAVDVQRPVDSSTPIKMDVVLGKNDVTPAAFPSSGNGLQTRAAMKGLDSANGWEKDDQFVVNAHYYYSTTTTLAQDFMVDTPVTYTTSGTSWYGTTNYWDYSPIKYWPQQGYLDFFAVYPQDYYVHNLDRQRLFHEELDNTIIKTRFYLDAPIAGVATDKIVPLADGTGDKEIKTYSDAIEQWDLMFSHRPHLSKPDITTPVKFYFSHAEMAVRFFVKDLNASNIGGLTIQQISLNNIHTGGLITAKDITDWQAYYAEFPDRKGIETSTAGAQTPVKLSYDWDWTSDDPLTPDIRDTYTQTMDFLWYNGTTAQAGTQINPDDKVFIIPPQCLGEGSGSSITVDYIITDIGHQQTYHINTFNVDICGEPGKVVNINLSLNFDAETHIYEIEPITCTLIPWEDVTGEIITDIEQ